MLVQNIVGEDHDGFHKLLGKAKAGMVKPWDAKPLKLVDVEAVSPADKTTLTNAFIIGDQIGGKLAEGTSGNPRQIKRFLNSMLLRTEIANALGFGNEIDAQVLAKLMLAEMIHKDFYDELARIVLKSPSGTVQDLQWLEGRAVVPVMKETSKTKQKDVPQPSETVSKWLDQIHLKAWAEISPNLAEIDLRPYVFVARDKRLIIADGVGRDKLDEVKSNILKNKLLAAKEEQSIKQLSPEDTERLFNDLREEMFKGSMLSEPPSFIGLRLIAKHHEKFEEDLLQCVTSQDVNKIGTWVVNGWKGVLKKPDVLRSYNDYLVSLSKQEDMPLVKSAAQTALSSQRRSK